MIKKNLVTLNLWKFEQTYKTVSAFAKKTLVISEVPFQKKKKSKYTRDKRQKLTIEMEKLQKKITKL